MTIPSTCSDSCECETTSPRTWIAEQGGNGHWPVVTKKKEHGSFDLNLEHNSQNVPWRRTCTNSPPQLTKFSKKINSNQPFN